MKVFLEELSSLRKYGHQSSAGLWGRIKLAWNILRNRPTGYKLDINMRTGISLDSSIMLWNCTVSGVRSEPKEDKNDGIV